MQRAAKNSESERPKTQFSSISLWLEGAKRTAGIELHMNYWVVRDKAAKGHWLDFGVMIPRDITCANLSIHIPDENVMIESLGFLFADEDIARAVFNENLSTKKDDKIITLEWLERTVSVWDFMRPGDCKETVGNGKLISFDIARLRKEEKQKIKGALYLRFRLRGNYIEQLLKIEKRGTIAFDSVFTSTQVFDFRVNQIRSTDVNIKGLLQKGKAVFAKLHFFLIVPSRDDFALSSEAIHAARHIENVPWAHYLTGNKKSKLFNDPLYTVYHWRKRGEVSTDKQLPEEFVLYAKFKTIRLGRRSLLLYLSVALVLGVISNGIFEGFKALANLACSKPQQKIENAQFKRSNGNKRKPPQQKAPVPSDKRQDQPGSTVIPEKTGTQSNQNQ